MALMALEACNHWRQAAVVHPATPQPLPAAACLPVCLLAHLQEDAQAELIEKISKGEFTLRWVGGWGGAAPGGGVARRAWSRDE